MLKVVALVGLLILAPAPASGVPMSEIWALTYCSLNPSSIYACIDRGIPPLIFSVLVEHVPGQRIYELSDGQLVALGLPLPSAGVLLDYAQVPGGNYLYSSDRDFYDGALLPFVALAHPLVAGLPPLGDDPPPIAESPEPATLILMATTLVTGWALRRRA